MAQLERLEDGVRLRLARDEVGVVVSLVEGVRNRLEGPLAAADGDGFARFRTPVVSNEVAVDDELREMLHDELRAKRTNRLTDLSVLLQRGGEDGFDSVLDRETSMRVVEALNDLRLALAASVGYDDELRDSLDDDDHRTGAVALMDALAWLQGGLIDFVESDPTL